MTKQELKKIACEAIDKNRDKIIALGNSIFAEPELGYKEVKTAAKIKAIFDELGYEYTDKVAITGIVAPRKGKESKMKVAVMGEMDAVVAPGHRCANKETGAAHSCGHNAMCASLVGVAYALAGTGVMDHLSGDIVLMAVPAEEYVEIEYRNGLKEAGKIHFLGGKQEFIKLGVMDDIDAMIMQHTTTPAAGSNECAIVANGSNGFVGKLIRYVGKEAHAGGAPHLGINALNAANIGLMAVGAQRETFKDEDHIRVHPIMTKGGDLVNVVPADVRLETYVRGANVEAIMDASAKVSRAFKAGGDAVGAKTIITDLPGYLPQITDPVLIDLMYNNIASIVGEDKVLKTRGSGGGSTDAGDVGHLMPTIHSYFVGASGIGHSESYEIADDEIAYILPAKALAMTAIDLLADGAEVGLEMKKNFKPAMTKQSYLRDWGHLDV